MVADDADDMEDEAAVASEEKELAQCVKSAGRQAA